MKSRQVALAIMAALLVAAGVWLIVKRPSPSEVPLPTGTDLRWEKIPSSDTRKAGDFYVASSKTLPIQCLIADLTDRDGVLSENSVDRVVPADEDGARVFHFSDQTSVESKPEEKGWHFSSKVALGVNDVFVREELGSHGVGISDLSFRAGEPTQYPLTGKLLQLIEAGDGAGRYNFHSKVYRFSGSGKVICIVLYTKA